jgi:hypothetical protein
VFENRETGRLSVGSWPNPPLWVWIAARALGHVVHEGFPHRVLGLIGTVALALWALLELWSGVNPWRRFLGIVVLGWMVGSALT